MNKRAILTIWPGTTTSNKEGKNGFEPTYEELKPLGMMQSFYGKTQF